MHQSVPIVKKGDRLRASDFNSVSRAVTSLQRSQGTYTGGNSRSRPYTYACGYNVGEYPIPYRGCGVVCDGYITNNGGLVPSRDSVYIRTPIAGDDLTRIVVCMETILPGKSGKVVVQGLVWASVTYTFGCNKALLPIGSNMLMGDAAGVIPILQHDPANSIALIQIGSSTGSSSVGAGQLRKGAVVSHTGDSPNFLYTVNVLSWDEASIVNQHVAVTVFPPLPFAFPDNYKVLLVYKDDGYPEILV